HALPPSRVLLNDLQIKRRARSGAKDRGDNSFRRKDSGKDGNKERSDQTAGLPNQPFDGFVPARGSQTPAPGDQTTGNLHWCIAGEVRSGGSGPPDVGQRAVPAPEHRHELLVGVHQGAWVASDLPARMASRDTRPAFAGFDESDECPERA